MRAAVTVLGAGAGGRGLSVHLTLRGCQVVLTDRYAAFLDPLRSGQIEYVGALGEDAAPIIPVEDPVDAVRASPLVFIATTAAGQEWALKTVATANVCDQAVVILSGCMGSVLAALVLDRDAVIVGETSTFPLSARIASDGRCQIRRTLRPRVAAFPGHRSAALVAHLHGLIDVTAADTILETCLCNPNPLIHAGAMLLNVAHLERQGFDAAVPLEGITPKAIRLIDALDQERRAVARAYGYELPSVDGLYEELSGRHPPFREPVIPLPQPLQPRFLTEDVPFGIALWISLAEAAEVEVPLMSALYRLFGVLDPHLKADVRTLRQLGLAGLAAAELIAYLRHGYPR
jgi:opine dehydrogenase